MSSGKVNCTCGWSWNKSDSSKKDMYICHECGRDNSNNIPKAQLGEKVVAESTGVYKKPFNERELKNIIKDDVEYTRTGDIKKPRAEANKFEKFLPDKKTVNFFKKMKKEVGPAIFREALKIQHERGNPSVNVGTNKGLPFHNRRNYNPFTNEINIPKGLPDSYDDINNYIEEVGHAGQPLSYVIPRFLKNDIPGYIKAYTTEGDSGDNTDKYVYNNPNTVENYTHNKVQPKLEQRINSAFSWPKSKEEEEEYLDLMLKYDMPKQKNGGWLDSYVDGGTMQEHQENYNDSEASAPEGMIGDGYSNVGRNYSPAWGGQFEDGGFIPMAQNGKATSADSLAVYNDVMRTKNYYETHNTKYFNKPEISPGWWADKIIMDKIKKDHLKHPDVTAANKQKIRQNKNPNQYLLSDMITGAIDPNAPLFRYDTRIAPQGEITYNPKSYLAPAIKKLDPNFEKLSDSENSAIIKMLSGYGSTMTPEQILIYRKWKGKHPHDLKKMQALDKLDIEVSNHTPGYITTLPYYDPLAVKPYNLRTPQEKIDWQKQYGSTKDKDKDKDKPIKNTPVVERGELTSLQPMSRGLENTNIQIDNSDINIPIHARVPQSYDVTSQRQTMNGPNDYYDYNEQGVSIEQAVKAKQAADAYNQSILEKYGNNKNPKAQERLKQLKQDIELTPHYQMGGSVYPVNYVPQAQNGWLENAENSVNKWLGNPMRTGEIAGNVFGEKWFNPKTKKWEIEGRDNVRHSFSGRYTSEAIQNKFPSWMQYTGIPQAAGIVGATGLGAGHELSTLIGTKNDKRSLYNKIRESGEDAFNNMIGAGVGSLPVSSEIKTNTLGKLSDDNLLPDGVSGRANSVYVKHAMGGSIPGAVGFTYARTQSPAPSNGPYAKKTKASAQNGGWLNKYDVAQNGKRLNDAAQMINTINARKQPGYHRDSPNINIKEIPRQSINDKIAAPKKLHTTDLDKLNVRNKTKAELDAQELANDNAIAAQRLAVRKNAEANPLHSWAGTFDSKNWNRQNVEDSSADLESMFRMSDKPNFFDDWLNPLNQIGGMAADLGAAPNQIVQQNSMMPLVTAVGTPLLTGLLEGHGVKNNRQFVNNLINPVNFVPGYHAAEKYLLPKIKKTLAKGALPMLKEAKKIETLGRETVRGINDNVIYPIKYKKQIADIKKLHGELASQLGADEGVKRLKGVLGIDPTNLDYPSLTTTPGIGSHYSPLMNNINMDFRQLSEFKNSPKYMLPANTVHGHEVGHWMQREADRFGPAYQEALAKYNSNKAMFFEPSFPTSNPTAIDRFAQQLYGYDKGTNMIDISGVSNQVDMNTLYDNAKYFTNRGAEPLAHLREMRQNMLNKGYIKNIYDPISEETINKFISENFNDRVSSFTIPGSKQTKGLETIFRNLPSVIGAAAVGTGAAYQMQNQKPVSGMKEGGVIKDDRGQWDHPGEITEIGSNNITMQGVPYPVLGISDTGDTKLMKPGKNYKYKGKKVTEYPLSKNGKELVKLDQLTNFTNYNKPQPGGWLNKYN